VNWPAEFDKNFLWKIGSPKDYYILQIQSYTILTRQQIHENYPYKQQNMLYTNFSRRNTDENWCNMRRAEQSIL